MKNVFYWKAICSDGAFDDRSKRYFNTKKECYNDMRNAVLEKMKWNTEYDQDFGEEDGCVEYNVMFNPTTITHESYSGLYTYTIYEYNEVVEKFKQIIETFETLRRECRYINARPWVTDCADNYEKWHEMFKKNGKRFKDFNIVLEVSFKFGKYSDANECIVSSILQQETEITNTNDNELTFWNVDFHPNDLTKLVALIKACENACSARSSFDGESE